MIKHKLYQATDVAFLKKHWLAKANLGKEYRMSVVIVGGNERMENQYHSICKSFGYKSKIFTKESGAIKKKIGSPDLMILFTNTVSHKMVLSASQKAKKNNIPIACCHSSSVTALSNLFNEICNTAV